jgi:hypothetical protein
MSVIIAALAVAVAFLAGRRDVIIERVNIPAVAMTAARAGSVVRTPPGGVGQLDIAARGSRPGTPWLVEDWHHDPMAWVNLYELASGGDGGVMPGGLVCSTFGTRACLTPRGQLLLWQTGPGGPAGRPVVLTAADVRWLHHAEHPR